MADLRITFFDLILLLPFPFPPTSILPENPITIASVFMNSSLIFVKRSLPQTRHLTKTSSSFWKSISIRSGMRRMRALSGSQARNICGSSVQGSNPTSMILSWTCSSRNWTKKKDKKAMLMTIFNAPSDSLCHVRRKQRLAWDSSYRWAVCITGNLYCIIVTQLQWRGGIAMKSEVCHLGCPVAQWWARRTIARAVSGSSPAGYSRTRHRKFDHQLHRSEAFCCSFT